jgi:hypothetical protein
MSNYIKAINGKFVIELRYHSFNRIVEPHAYGISSKGHRILRCYQIAGGSQSNEPQGWKLLTESEIASAHLTGQNFVSPRAGYKRGDAAMTTILAQL